jgi:hypothetical protein
VDIHQIPSRVALHHIENIEEVSPVGSRPLVNSMPPIHQAMHQKLDAIFAPHRVAVVNLALTPSDAQQAAAIAARTHNSELDSIRDDRAQRLFDAGYTVADMETATDIRILPMVYLPPLNPAWVELPSRL